ncbi:MAG: TIGR00266 family protein [Candidatus Methanomethylophilaceae archaeon]
MRYTITGDNLQFVNIELGPGEEIKATPGNMKYMSGNMEMETKMEGGLLKGLKRSMIGASFFLVTFRPRGGTGVVGLGGNVPGKIIDLQVVPGKNWLLQKTSYIASQPGVDVDIAFQKKLGGAFYGGEGLILQRVSGNGIVWASACGDFNVVDLRPGEQYKISTGNIVGWEESVTYDISSIGGFKNTLFGGEGVFVTTLTGPGKIIIQSMSLAELAASLIPYLPSGS